MIKHNIINRRADSRFAVFGFHDRMHKLILLSARLWARYDSYL